MKAIKHSRGWYGKPTTKQSRRPTDRAPHMGKYVRAGTLYGQHGVHIVIGNQAFFLPIAPTGDPSEDVAAHAVWMRDMLCIALANLVKIETGESV